jgi:hypothetical protein
LGDLNNGGYVGKMDHLVCFFFWIFFCFKSIWIKILFPASFFFNFLQSTRVDDSLVVHKYGGVWTNMDEYGRIWTGMDDIWTVYGSFMDRLWTKRGPHVHIFLHISFTCSPYSSIYGQIWTKKTRKTEICLEAQ